MTTDPVCGMKLDEKQAVAKTEYQGDTYYFCSTHCQKTFSTAPQKYAAKRAASGAHHGSSPSGQH